MNTDLTAFYSIHNSENEWENKTIFISHSFPNSSSIHSKNYINMSTVL